MASTIDKVKHALHLDKSSTGTHTTGTTTGHTTGHTTGTAEGVHGPHGTRAANAADPRVDSDRDGSHNIGSNTHSTVGHTGATTGHSTTAGPHTSNLANKADPRVDSDRDGSANFGAAHNTHNTAGLGNTHNTHNTTGLGNPGTYSGTTGGVSHSTNSGPHNSNLLNKADPRVDSDRDGSANLGGAHNTHNTSGLGNTGTYSGTHAGNTHGTHTGTTGGVSHSTNAGPHNSNLLNKADPLVDSDLDGRGNRHGATTHGITGASGSHATAGSGTAQNTAGPHNSDLLNKLDPRVDADLDGSKTIGGNKTHT